MLGPPHSQPIWSEPGGYFHDDLKDVDLKDVLAGRDLDVRMHPVNWPGSNSVLERDGVAKWFGKLLDDHAERDAGCVQLVIARSHGGNIALEAARRYVDANVTHGLYAHRDCIPAIAGWLARTL